MHETPGDVLVRYRALAERVAFGLCPERASAVVACATQELALEPVGAATASLGARFLRRVIELAGESATPGAPGEPVKPGAPVAHDATTLFGADVFDRAHARWRALERHLVALPEASFELFERRFQTRDSHADLAARHGEPAQAVAARERALVDTLRRAQDLEARA